jgi:hypothetical protein
MNPAAGLVLALQGGDPQGGKILGYLIVFFMVVWPLIRAAVEAAQERRRKFIEEEERRARRERREGRGTVARTGAPPQGGRPEMQDPFEALRRALTRHLEGDEDTDEPPRRSAAPKPAAPRPATQANTQKAAQKATQRPAQRPPTPTAPSPAPAPPRELAGDPFDERLLERPLVADPELARVPSEGGLPVEVTARLAQAKAEGQPPFDASAPAADPILHGLTRVARSGATRHPRDAAQLLIARHGRTAWAQGVLYEELLGPPVALREPRW